MDKEEIEDYLKRVDELWDKLTGEDKETLQWLIYGYNQCAKLLNETKQQCKNQKEVIYKLKEWINIVQQNKDNKHLEPFISTDELDGLLDILKEVNKNGIMD